MSNPFKPDVNTSRPAAAPPIKENEPPERKLAGQDGKTLIRRKRGKAGLRIDLQTGGVPRDRTGLNVPQG